jgi:hypothetical protein
VTEEGYIRSKPASRNISDPMQAQLSEAEREVLAGLVECHPQPEAILLQAPLEICRAQLSRSQIRSTPRRCASISSSSSLNLPLKNAQLQCTTIGRRASTHRKWTGLGSRYAPTFLPNPPRACAKRFRHRLSAYKTQDTRYFLVVHTTLLA